MIARRALLWLTVSAMLVYTLFPFYWALNGSLQPAARLFAIPADYWPWPPSAESYRSVLANSVFLKAVRNSIVVATCTTLAALAAGSLAAYALARFRMRGQNVALGMILAMTMFPQIAVVGAIHSMMTALGLYNSLTGLCLSYMLFTLPLTTWVLTGFFRGLPRQLEESAYIDGAGPWKTSGM